MNYEKIEHGLVVVLEAGDEIISSLESLVKKEAVQSGSFIGIGAVKDIKLGFYDVENKQYLDEFFKGYYELVSMMGNITYFEAKPVIHCHAVIGDKEHKLHGGHLYTATVTATTEIFIRASHDRIERKYDDKIGLNLIKL